MKAQLLVFMILLSFTFAGIPWKFTNCGTENDPQVVTGMVLSAVPEKQVSDNITIVGVSNVHGNLQSVIINVLLTGVQITSFTSTFVQSLDPGDMWIFKYSSYIPSIAPTGTYTLQFFFLNSKGVRQACTEMLMDL